MSTSIVLQAKGINKFFSDPVPQQVLKDIHFTITSGEFVSVVGKSGCGKSTLLYILSTMDTDYTGELFLDGEKMSNQSESTLAAIRNKKIGFVFQFHYLLNEFTVLENVSLPAYKLNALPKEAIHDKAIQLLKKLGIEHLALKRANLLSGGEKQRVAIARAMINDPIIIMGDEPTGNLDKKNTAIVFDIFKELTMEFQQTLLIVTHDDAFARNTSRTIVMDDGKIVESGL
ncbi:MAG: ABC transporter ATP-binding protein [Cytophagaceae bacterium]|jgi:lipoprotein-releasing system ATP-binding protein|nr:ABC transporter ATP-binding protein [Cytophagaceae bacterium]